MKMLKQKTNIDFMGKCASLPVHRFAGADAV